VCQVEGVTSVDVALQSGSECGPRLTMTDSGSDGTQRAPRSPLVFRDPVKPQRVEDGAFLGPSGPPIPS